MSRWHQPSCTAPDIFVDAGTPQCRACSRCYCGGQLASQGSITRNAPPQIPANEPAGQLNLRWPPVVPYRGNLCSPSNPTSLPASLAKANDSVIFCETLSCEEIRLARLESSGDENSPVHLSLEKHMLANTLEYETVSYMWGGEDGDYTPSRPVFVGSYWDVILQTPNCWGMLKTVRPRQGSRLIWVDALCINQQNDVERSEQVANMRRIYEQCMQVIVYLGPDLATSNVVSRYRLHELETHFGSLALTLPISLHDILKRKYFSRIWVIQELILSQRALFRIKHYEFWADSRTAHCLPPSWTWDSTEARWVQFMATKTLPVKNILELLQLASQSHASDPRDKLFGLLGLYQGDASAQALPPDYSLSVQNVFLGFFAYCLVNLKHVDLLYRAAGLGAPKSSPSWVPNWEADWPHIFTTPAVDSDEMAGRITQHIGCSKLGILQPDSKAPRWARSLIFRDQPQSPEWAEALFHRRPWFHDASIHANTGALRVYLTHFCAISRRPSLVDTIGSSGLFEVLGNSSRLFLASETNLESTVDPTDDHLFILNTGNSKLIYLILRPLAYPRTYKMIAACTHLFIHFHGGITPFRSLSISSVAVGISVIRSGLNISMADLTGMNMYFPSAETGWDTLSAYWGMYRQQDHTSPAFQAAYLSCIDPVYCPRIVNGFIELTIKSYPKHWPHFGNGILPSMGDVVSICGFPGIPGITMSFRGTWEKRRLGLWTQASMFCNHWTEATKWRTPLSVAWSAMQVWFRLVMMVHRILGCSCEELEMLIRRGVPDDDDRCHLLGLVPGELEDDFAADGHTYQLDIL